MFHNVGPKVTLFVLWS